MRTLVLIVAVLIAGAAARADSFSSLVYPGPDGRLVYVADEQGNRIPDFSMVGYGTGIAPIPTVPVRATVTPAGDDDAAAVQAAIDSVSALPLGPYGFRGAVYLTRGRYELARPLVIAASGVVLRGEGEDDAGTILVGNGVFAGLSLNERFGALTLLKIGGAAGPALDEGAARRIADEYVPLGATSFRVADARGLKAGDTVIVRRHGNEAWIHELGMDLENKEWAWKPRTHEFDRVIVSVAGDLVTVDAPIVVAIDERWGGGEVIPYRDPGRIERVGVEYLRAESAYNPAVRRDTYGNIDRPNFVGEPYFADEDHYWNFIVIENAKNCWVRNVTALHFASSTVSIQPHAKWVTVRDCTTKDPVSFCAGSRRFTYRIEGQLSLVEGCVSDRGRHSFVLGAACGPNVFVDCTATRPYSSSEPHSGFGAGSLYDNVHAPLTARFWKDISIGWAGANTVFWNCEGPFLIQQPPTAQNYAIGHIGIHAMVFNTFYQDHDKPNGFIESWDRHVTPESLYRAQLRDRLGSHSDGKVTR